VHVFPTSIPVRPRASSKNVNWRFDTYISSEMRYQVWTSSHVSADTERWRRGTRLHLHTCRLLRGTQNGTWLPNTARMHSTVFQTSYLQSASFLPSAQLNYPLITYYWTVPLKTLKSCWEIKKFKNRWQKSVRILEGLNFLLQQFWNLSSSQRDMSRPILGDLSNHTWSRGTMK
jgi:hypothetical protein